VKPEVGEEPAIRGGERRRWCERGKRKEAWRPLLGRRESKERKP